MNVVTSRVFTKNDDNNIHSLVISNHTYEQIAINLQRNVDEIEQRIQELSKRSTISSWNLNEDLKLLALINAEGSSEDLSKVIWNCI